jgi:dTDP-glucose pyrophosphorylase
MTIVIPMAGRGQRFIDQGHSIPKFCLEAHGKTLLEWSVDSLPLDLAHRVVFVALREHDEQFGVRAMVRRCYGHRVSLSFVLLDAVTRGQAETVMRAEPFIAASEPLLIFNIDTMFRSPTLRRNLAREDVDGVLGCFRSRGARFSFAVTDEQGWVTRVTEKEPISEYALTGLYHFRKGGDFLDSARAAILSRQLSKGEFYIAPLYNTLIARGARLVLDAAPVHHVLGTPEEYRTFRAFAAADLAPEVA